ANAGVSAPAAFRVHATSGASGGRFACYRDALRTAGPPIARRRSLEERPDRPSGRTARTVRRFRQRAMNRRLASIQALLSLVALAAVVWWASRQNAPELPSTAGAFGWLLAGAGLYCLAT